MLLSPIIAEAEELQDLSAPLTPMRFLILCRIRLIARQFPTPSSNTALAPGRHAVISPAKACTQLA
jgi:hypothetical protein